MKENKTMPEIPFTQKDRDLLIKHDVKMAQLCTSVKDLKTNVKEGFNVIGEKLDTGIVACPTNRANCRKEIDKEMDDERKSVDEKINKKVDWKYFGGVVTLLTFILIFIEYTTK